MNAVQRLHQYRMSLSTTTYKSRGQRVERCEFCRLAKKFCICELAPLAQVDVIKPQTQTAFLLLMYDTEVLKPSNTGKLIADLIPDTYAFLWSRTEKNEALQTLLDDEQWQPFVVFPETYAENEREVYNSKVICSPNKRPLFIMLDGSWREAKKMFRKSPYLNKFPLVSFDPKLSKNTLHHSPVGEYSRYTVRKTKLEHQFSTAEVAARVLDMFGEHENAMMLDLWFDVFNYQYQKGVCQRNQGNVKALENYQKYINN